MPTSTQLFNRTLVSSAEPAADFISNFLESSTEYSIIGNVLDGKILLWNEGARRFAVAGNQKFLVPFQNGLKGVAEQPHRLESLILVADREASLFALEPLIAKRIAVAQRRVDLRPNSGFEAARQEMQ